MGKQWTNVISFRAFGSDNNQWLEIYQHIRDGREKLVSCKVVDEDTIEIITEER